MGVPFADSYIEKLFAERDLMGLYHLISVVSDERRLPEEFWIFSRVLEWVGSTRSGVWQYYEGLSPETFVRMTQELDRFGLSEIAERYRSGKGASKETNQAASLDRWIDVHEQQIQSAVFELICVRKRDLLHEV